MGVSVTVALGFGMLVPVLPRYAKDFGVTLAAIGLVNLVFGFTRFSFGLVGGIVIDRFGDRASTISGLLIVALSSYSAGLATNFPQLVAARGFGGVGSAFFIAGMQNRILRIIEPGAMGRATGVFRSSFLIGFVVGPLLGSIVEASLGPSAVFHVYATGLLVATVIAWFVMAATEQEAKVQVRRPPLEALRAARPLFRDRRYVTALLATFVGWYLIAGPAQVVGVVFAEEELGFSEVQIGLATTLLAVGEIIVLAFSGRASDTYGRRAVLIPSLVVGILATATLGQVEALRWAFFPLYIAIGASIAAGSTAAGGLLADSMPKGGSGAAVGVNHMAGDFGYMLSPILLGTVVGGTGYGPAYILAAVPVVFVLLYSLGLPAGAEVKKPVEQPVEPLG
jgi:MFS family permease